MTGSSSSNGTKKRGRSKRARRDDDDDRDDDDAEFMPFKAESMTKSELVSENRRLHRLVLEVEREMERLREDGIKVKEHNDELGSRHDALVLENQKLRRENMVLDTTLKSVSPLEKMFQNSMVHPTHKINRLQIEKGDIEERLRCANDELTLARRELQRLRGTVSALEAKAGKEACDLKAQISALAVENDAQRKLLEQRNREMMRLFKKLCDTSPEFKARVDERKRENRLKKETTWAAKAPCMPPALSRSSDARSST